MFVELNNLLNTTPDRAEQGKLTVLCDAKTDGSFLVHHFLSFYLKANCKVCFVALFQSFSHYNIVGQKLGVNLTVARERGQLVFLEGLKSAVDVFFQTQEEPHPLQFLREANAGNLKPLFEFVREALKPVDGGEARWTYPVLLVDDLSVLLSLGVGAVAVLDFIHYCRATVCWELKVLLQFLPELFCTEFRGRSPAGTEPQLRPWPGHAALYPYRCHLFFFFFKLFFSFF
nr:elongator complex protein 6 isoform X5 [Chlorocebus sabaeus]